MIDANIVSVYLYIAQRTWLIAFAENTEEHGTTKITDGLWINHDGKRIEKERPTSESTLSVGAAEA